jgi:hypothetical protein
LEELDVSESIVIGNGTSIFQWYSGTKLQSLHWISGNVKIEVDKACW